jgi:putative copper resistance protein D
LIDPLIIVRDFHLMTTVILAGVTFFDLFIVLPLWRSESHLPTALTCFGSSSRRLLRICLTLSLASALLWLCLLSMRIGAKGFSDAIADGTVWLVLSQTQFGFVWQMRLLFGGSLVACLSLRRTPGGHFANGLTILATLFATAYLGSLAFAGHGTEGLGWEQEIHLGADFLHLIGAGLWLGGLFPFVLILVCLLRFREKGWLSAAAHIGARFSIVGLVAVGVLLFSGTINAAFLVSGTRGLTDTDYGRLLLLKIALFSVMVCFASINRRYLLPRLFAFHGTDQADATVRRLVQSALIEMALGLAIICIVGLIGIMPPTGEVTTHMH